MVLQMYVVAQKLNPIYKICHQTCVTEFTSVMQYVHWMDVLWSRLIITQTTALQRENYQYQCDKNENYNILVACDCIRPKQKQIGKKDTKREYI